MSQPGDQDDRSRSRTVLLATDSSQSVIGEIVDGRTHTIAYSAYGEQSAQQNVETRLGFNGQLRETNIGWYLLGNGYRAYNPRLMRFHSPDSWSPFGGGGLNAYMYCVGDPVNSSDPTGHFKTGDSKLKGIRKLDAFLFGGSTVTGAYGNAPSIGGGPSLATSVKAPVKAPGKGSFINSLMSDVAVMAGYGASRRAPGKIASPSSGKNGADGVTIGGEGNPGIDMLNFAKQNSNKMDILSSRPRSFDIPAQKKNVSPPTSARATASTVTPSYPDFKWSNNGLGLKGGLEPLGRRDYYSSRGSLASVGSSRSGSSNRSGSSGRSINSDNYQYAAELRELDAMFRALERSNSVSSSGSFHSAASSTDSFHTNLFHSPSSIRRA